MKRSKKLIGWLTRSAAYPFQPSTPVPATFRSFGLYHINCQKNEKDCSVYAEGPKFQCFKCFSRALHILIMKVSLSFHLENWNNNCAGFFFPVYNNPEVQYAWWLMIGPLRVNHQNFLSFLTRSWDRRGTESTQPIHILDEKFFPFFIFSRKWKERVESGPNTWVR